MTRRHAAVIACALSYSYASILVISLANITVSSRRSAILAYSVSAFSLINMFLSLQRRTYTFIAFARECVVWRVREGRVELRRILNRI